MEDPTVCTFAAREYETEASHIEIHFSLGHGSALFGLDSLQVELSKSHEQPFLQHFRRQALYGNLQLRKELLSEVLQGQRLARVGQFICTKS